MAATKIKIITRGIDPSGTIPGCLKDRWLESFEFESYDEGKTYHPQEHIIWKDQYDPINWDQVFLDRGFKIIKNHLWDSKIDDPPVADGQILRLRAKEWIWIHEHLLYRSYGYQEQVIDRDPNRFMLLLMNLIRPHRDQLITECRGYLDDSLYSYVGRGILIEGDEHISSARPNGNLNDRYFNPSWYWRTNFSLVSETLVNNQLFISEKSFKPLAFKHPFIINGSPETLVYLRSLGFKTFDHIIDESYDTTLNSDAKDDGNFWLQNGNNNDRLAKIMSLLNYLYKEYQNGNKLFFDSESLERIEHNHRLFFDQCVVDKLWKNQIADVINEFCHAQ